MPPRNCSGGFGLNETRTPVCSTGRICLDNRARRTAIAKSYWLAIVLFQRESEREREFVNGRWPPERPRNGHRTVNRKCEEKGVWSQSFESRRENRRPLCVGIAPRASFLETCCSCENLSLSLSLRRPRARCRYSTFRMDDLRDKRRAGALW